MLEFLGLAALNACILVVMFLYLKARITKYLELSGIVASLREEVSRLVLELNGTTDRNLSLVEDSIKRLKDTVDKADRKVSVLNKEIVKRDTETQAYARLSKSRPLVKDDPERSRSVPDAPGNESVPGEVRSMRESMIAAFRESVSDAESVTEPFDRPMEKPLARQFADRRPAEPSATVQNVHSGEAVPEISFGRRNIIPELPLRERVIALFKKGISPEMVARNLSVPLGEVELILSLEEQRYLTGE